ncbi:MAG: ATP-sensitive inward rectifier potassium channel 10 [Betaproteobacteria bacterium]|nr:ATP-sensitive inward rectifier potassium channel 10 [Betaproteobacteria bacterium]
MKQSQPRRMRVQIGARKYTKIGVTRRGWRDAYHQVLALSWPGFFLLIVLVYLATNVAFAVIYGLQPDGVANAGHGFLNRLFFSIETLSTVGYGYMYPVSVYAHVVASIEIFIGLLSLALVTGMMFARFSRPQARILFSRVAVVCSFDGAPTLMVRAANERHNTILEADVAMTLVREEITAEGERFYRQHDLPLTRHHSAAFALSWTVMHPITERSPLHGWTRERLDRAHALFAVSITGLDDVLEQSVHARAEYTAGQLLFGRRFVDVIVPADGGTILDLTRIHDTEPEPAVAPSGGMHAPRHRSSPTT